VRTSDGREEGSPHTGGPDEIGDTGGVRARRLGCWSWKGMVAKGSGWTGDQEAHRLVPGSRSHDTGPQKNMQNSACHLQRRRGVTERCGGDHGEAEEKVA
jgi:hypothetical protein